MGVPKFFRYISERYPCLSELVVDHNIPDFDNLYLDMNGIIHNCSHPNDNNVHFRISEDQIFKDIFSYIEFLFLIIKPKKLFFLAVDGVAPRAKMNQQRGRRFRSAKDAQVLEEKARKDGEELPEGDRFDSNCITPGTEFMDRLQKALEYFIQSKISANPVWQQCRVILSGHQTPGEGEHKIMEYIRYLKVQSNYDPDTRHCLYGLDADLIMLGLCTHERYFSLLREEVKFGRTAARVTSVNETKFFLLHLCLMREYLELEFTSIKERLTFPYDLERIIDDWILMGFLVGNDFIPHLPNLHINNNALPLLYNTYMKVLPTLDGYINEEGHLNLARFEKFMAELAEHDRDSFRQQYSDLEYFESKTTDNNDAFDVSLDEIKNGFSDDLSELVKRTEEMYKDDLEDADDILPMGDIADGEFFEKEFQQFKRNYYVAKLGFKDVTPEIRTELAEEYVRALQWTLFYYYCGVQSWGWFYPHHYSPFISDIQNFRGMDFKLSLGKPFLPFQQLLSVLPAASRKSIPTAYHELMTSPTSKIIDFYPTDFQTDLNGKKQEWEAVVLIPFMEEARLLDAMTACNDKLTAYEKDRNTHGPMYQYDYCPKGRERIEGVANFPALSNVMCSVTEVTRDDVHVALEKIVYGPSYRGPSSVYYPGFPTFKHLLYSARLQAKQVKVFDQPSRSDNMIIKLLEANDAKSQLKDIAAELLDQTVYTHWPHLAEGKVVEIFDAAQKLSAAGTVETNGREFKLAVGSSREHHMNRLGIDLGEIDIMVNVLPCLGHRYVYNDQKFVLEKIYSQIKVAYPLKATIRNLKAFDGNFAPQIDTDKMFSPGTSVFMLAPQYYGSFGVVTDTSMLRKTQRIKVSLCVPPEPNFNRAMERDKDRKKFHNGYNAAAQIGISTNVLARVTGTIFVYQGMKVPQVPDGTSKFNVGLQMRFVKNNEELLGYTKKTPQSWTYSDEAIAIIQAYAEKYPQLFQQLAQTSHGSADNYFEADLFPTEIGEGRVNEMVKWIKSQPHSSAERRTCGTVTLEKEIIEELVEAVEINKHNPIRQIILQVKPHLLYKANLTVSSTGPDPKADFHLFDRVTVASDSQIVPLGYKGTIVGIQRMVDMNPVRQERVRKEYVSFEILFDEEFVQGSSIYGIADKRMTKIAETNLINISYGLSLSNSKENKNNPAETAWKAGEKPLQNEVVKNQNESQTVALLQRLQIKPVANEEKAETIWNGLMNAAKPTLAKPPGILKRPVVEPPPAINETNTLKLLLGIGKSGEKAVVEPVVNKLPQPPKTWRSAPKVVEIEQPNVVCPAPQNAPNQTWRSASKMIANEQLNFERSAPQKEPTKNWRSAPKMVANEQPNFVHLAPQNDPSIVQAMNFQPPFPPFGVPPRPFNNPQIYQPQPYNQTSMNYFSARPSMGPPFLFSSYRPEVPKNIPQQQQQQRYQPNRYQQPQRPFPPEQRQTPNGPQSLNIDNAHSSAFVPLQAQIKSSRKQKLPAQQLPVPKNKFEARNSEQRAINEKKQEECKQNFAQFLEGKVGLSAETSEPPVPPVFLTKPTAVNDRKLPKSRIAANFGKNTATTADFT